MVRPTLSILILPIVVAISACVAPPGVGERIGATEVHLCSIPMRAPIRATDRKAKAGFVFRWAAMSGYRRTVPDEVIDVILDRRLVLADSCRTSDAISTSDAAIGLMAFYATAVDRHSDEFGDAIERLRDATDSVIDDGSGDAVAMPVVLTSALDAYGATGSVVASARAMKCARMMTSDRWFDLNCRMASPRQLERMAAWAALAVVEIRIAGSGEPKEERLDLRLAELVFRMHREMPESARAEMRTGLRSAALAMLLEPGATAVDCRVVQSIRDSVGVSTSLEEEFLLRTAAWWLGIDLPPVRELGRRADELDSTGGSVGEAGLELLLTAIPMRLGLPCLSE